MAARALLERDRAADAKSVGRRRPTPSAAGSSATALLRLQQSAGNAAVVMSLSATGSAPNHPAMAVQRCGPVPCNCSAGERAAYESEHADSGAERADGTPDEDSAIQRAGTPAVQRYEVEDCGSGAGARHPENEVHAAHGRARSMVSIAQMETADSTNPTVQQLARKYFKLTVPPASNKDKKLWFGRVRQVMSALDKSNSQATYECESKQSFANGACSEGAMAMTVLNIHLCPEWWSLGAEDRAFVLVHEWAHKFGPSVNQIFETYCDDKGFASLSAGSLVAQPDAYASYVYELVTGSAPSAAVCGTPHAGP